MFPNVRVQTIDWMNEHGTFRRKGVKRILPIAAASGNPLERWRRVGSVLMDVVGHAFNTSQPLRPDGSRWSLSQIARPDKLALSLAAHDVAEAVPDNWRTASYATALQASGLVPMLVSGSMKVQRLNRILAMRDLAIQTSGASDGQTLAGATATGTHGAAVRVGAIHDTVRAVHLMVGPKQAVLVQPSSKPLKELAAKDLSAWLGFPTKLESDDELFRAALVHLGSLGIVLNVVIETRPLYFWTEVVTAHNDGVWRKVLEQAHPGGVPGHRKDAGYVQLVINPYNPNPTNAPRAWVFSMVDADFDGQAGVETRPGLPEAPNPDLLALISELAELDDTTLSDAGLRKFMTSELVSRYGNGKRTRKGLPGVIFGPTGLPRGRGDSVEFVVDAGEAEAATNSVLAALDSERKAGRQFLGAIGVRFVKGSDALLAPNARPLSCFIELPSARSGEIAAVYKACGAALTAKGISYGCHWGQHLVGIKGGLKDWWGPARVQGWKNARHRLLSSPKARSAFASPILKAAGLG